MKVVRASILGVLFACAVGCGGDDGDGGATDAAGSGPPPRADARPIFDAGPIFDATPPTPDAGLGFDLDGGLNFGCDPLAVPSDCSGGQMCCEIAGGFAICLDQCFMLPSQP